MTAPTSSTRDVNVDVGPTEPARSRRIKRSDDDGWRVAFWFLLPALIGFLVFYLIPTVRAISLSFQDFNLLNGESEDVGWANYEKLWNDRFFWKAVRVTTKYVVINIVTQTILALALAVLMDRLTKSVVVRGIVLLPWILPNVLVGLLWLFMLDPTVGIMNDILGWVGVEARGWLNNTTWVIPSLAFINTWKFTGYTALLLFAGMQTIPKNLYEAGALDGSSEWQMFRSITLPLLRPVLAMVLVISIIGSFQVFDVVQAASGGLGGTAGDPQGEARVIYLLIYENAFLFNKMGYAAAIATVLMLALMLMTIAQLRLLRANESDLA